MATARGRKSPNLIDRLVAEPGDFPFVQTIRLIERLTLGRNLGKEPVKLKPIGGYHHPKLECIYFNAETALLFPMGEVSQLTQSSADGHNNNWNITVSFMGLMGPSGVLPYHYSELIVQRLKLNDISMRDFFDMLNHRVISHFYRASIKYKMLPSFERSHLISDSPSVGITHKSLASSPPTHQHNQSQALLALAGLGDSSLQNRLSLSDDALISTSGFLQQQIRSVKNLEQIIKFHFGIDATIEQFQGEWKSLQPDFQTKISNSPDVGNNTVFGMNNVLGKNTILGKKVWQVQGKFSVMLQPKNWDEFMEFSPDSLQLRAMENLIHLYVGIELDFDFTIRFDVNQIPRAQLKQPKIQTQKSEDQPLRLGWNCKIANNIQTRHSKPQLASNNNSDVFIRVTRRAMHQTA